MKSVYVFIILALLLATAHAQTAKVVQLTPDEAKQAKALYAEQVAIAVKIEAFRANITAKYLDPDKSNTKDFSQWPWGYGFEYSDDYHFIVPRHPPVGASQYGGISGSCFLSNPVGLGQNVINQ